MRGEVANVTTLPRVVGLFRRSCVRYRSTVGCERALRWCRGRRLKHLATTDSPLKVSRVTKERVRLGAALFACTQGEFVDRAVAEYLESRQGKLREQIDGA